MQEIIRHDVMPSVALKGIVVFPGCTGSILLGREASIKAIGTVPEHGGRVFLVPQLDPSYDRPSGDRLSSVGVIAELLQDVRLQGGEHQLLVEGICRAERLSDAYGDDGLSCLVASIEQKKTDPRLNSILVAGVRAHLQIYSSKVAKLDSNLLDELDRITDASSLCDNIASAIVDSFEDRLEMLAEADVAERCGLLINFIKREVEARALAEYIGTLTQHALQSRQKELFLREQLAVIRHELGEDTHGEYFDRINNADLPRNVREELLSQNEKLAKIPFGSAELTVIRNYIETCLELPWQKYTNTPVNISEAKEILDRDHDGLSDVKERIIEFLAVKQLNPDIKGQILLLVGPPGVGKTSVARSVARATGRAFARVSLGGIHDEAEIRGHRRTYVGAMPGRITDALRRAGTSDPVILLDELDKLTRDMHGDPTAAMLEVLDPEQNVAFRDNFIEIPIDLSHCLFIATANSLDGVPAALVDRMEVIHISSYTDEEKLSIAKNHLIPKQIKQNGLKRSQIRFTDGAIYAIMRGYTRESGVRSLERTIASVCRKAAKTIIEERQNSITVSEKAVERMLGHPKYRPDLIYKKDEVGTVNGLAWTSVGGEMLRIEVLSMPGSGKVELTGSLGDVMKESAMAAVSYIRKHSKELGIDPDFHKNLDLHIHVPEGAVPKDGPSAGVTICTAIVSELTGRPARRDVAMTGEITLTGRVLPIGGLREKSVAAYKAGADKVIIPIGNMPDLDKVDSTVKDALNFVPVESIGQVLIQALV